MSKYYHIYKKIELYQVTVKFLWFYIKLIKPKRLKENVHFKINNENIITMLKQIRGHIRVEYST